MFAVGTNLDNQNGNTQEAERVARDAEGLQRGSRDETSVSGIPLVALTRCFKEKSERI